MKAIALQTGEFFVDTHVVWLRSLQELDHLPDDVVARLVAIGAAEYIQKPTIKPKRGRPGPTELKNNEEN